ncbi:MAG: hypothetical protein HXX11_11885 [Desulfuromonadales bacterium]|nr:hypothetical protein [Desulfuromonadales bacterium]
MLHVKQLNSKITQGRENLFVGAAGEHWVAACLLRRGFNANVLPVDTGVDLLATKKSRYSDDMMLYKIQVKTTAGLRAIIRFEKSKIDNLIQSRVNLVLVSWPSIGEPRCAVFSPRLLQMMTSGGFNDTNAPLRATGDFINMTVKFTDEGGVFVRNQMNPYTPVVNRLDLIEPVDCDVYSLPDYAMWSDIEGRLIDFDDEPHVEEA